MMVNIAIIMRIYHSHNKCVSIYISVGDIIMVNFNPSKVEKSVITVRIETTKLQTIDALSSKVDISRNEFIMQCIDFALEHYPQIGKENNST